MATLNALNLAAFSARIPELSDDDLVRATVQVMTLLGLAGRDESENAGLVAIEDELLDEQMRRGFLPLVFDDLKVD